MDYNVVALEISDTIAHFNYYDRLITNAVVAEEQAKLRSRNHEHVTKVFGDIEFYNIDKQLRPLYETKELIIHKLKSMETSDVHELVEKLEKDAKKMKKLYKSVRKVV